MSSERASATERAWFNNHVRHPMFNMIIESEGAAQ